MKKKICLAIAIGCAIVILGTAGLCDAEKISLTEVVIRNSVALPILLISLLAGGYLK